MAVDSLVTSGEVAPSAVAVDSPVTSGTAAPSVVAVDSSVAGSAAPSAVAVDSSVAGSATQTAKRHSKQDAIDAIFGKPVPVQAPGTPETSAVIPFASSTPVKQPLKQTTIGTFLKGRSVPVAVDTSAPSGSAAPTVAVDSSVTSGNVAPGSLVLRWGKPDAGKGALGTGLNAFRESIP